MTDFGKHTFFTTLVCPALGAVPHAMSTGHSDAFELGVHWRKHWPPLASAGTCAQNVSGSPGSSMQYFWHGIEQTPGVVPFAPRHVVPLSQSASAKQ